MKPDLYVRWGASSGAACKDAGFHMDAELQVILRLLAVSYVTARWPCLVLQSHSSRMAWLAKETDREIQVGSRCQAV